jgi:hypothetical protein
MNDSTQQLIRELAEKLGTTAEHLWGVLVRQAPISGTLGLLGIAALLGFVYIAWKRLTKIDFTKWDHDLAKGTMYGGLLIATVIALLSLLLLAPLYVAGILNPEYWALRQILK